MAYQITTAVNLGSFYAGSTVKAALFHAGTIHATVRDLSTTEIGGGLFEFDSSAVPDGYRGVLVLYIGTLGAATTFSGVTVLGGEGLNPVEFEAPTLSTSERQAIATTLLDLADSVETGLTVRQHLRLAASVMFGKSSNDGADYRDFNDTKTRINSTLDSTGNRVAITRDAT